MHSYHKYNANNQLNIVHMPIPGTKTMPFTIQISLVSLRYSKKQGRAIMCKCVEIKIYPKKQG